MANGGAATATAASHNSTLSREPQLRDPFCWERLPLLDRLAAAHTVAAGGHHLRLDRPVMLRTDAYHIRTPHQNEPDCMHTCLGAIPRLYALAIARFVLPI